MINESKHPIRTNIAYGIGSLGDSLSYNIFYSYFIYFITTFAGISPSIAGTISFLAVAWDAITDPLIGYLSDHSHSRYGRRSPFLILFSIPLGITVFALFRNPSFSETGKIAYYLVINILFWLFFTCTDIPYLSFGAELASDYDERTNLRKWARLFMSVGDIIVVAGTLPLVDYLAGRIGDKTYAWTVLGAIFGGISAVAFFTSGVVLRKLDRPAPSGGQSASFMCMLREYGQVLKIKECQKIILIAFIANLIIGIGSSSNMFVWTYTFQFQSAQISVIGLVGTVCAMFAAFPAAQISSRFGKKVASAMAFGLIIAGYMILYFLPHTLLFAMIAQIIKLSGMSMFWTIVYSLAYDIAEVDEFKNGCRREGLITSLISFFMKVGVSIGMWFAGIILEFVHLDPSRGVQSVGTISGLNFTTMIIPAIIAAVGLFTSQSYRISREKFVLLQTALTAKKEGREYSSSGFEDILK